MKKYLYILLSIACAAGIVACEKSDDGAAALNNKDAASLTISVDVPTFSATTRSIATDPENSGNSWTNWDKFVDGALLYRVTIFVIDSNNKLAAWRNIYSGGDIQATTDTYGGNGFWENSNNAVNTDATTGVAVKATFDSANPLHPKEQLQAGNYKVVAVANYAPIDTSSAVYDGTNTYLGLGSATEDGTSVKNGDGGDFTTLVNKIINFGVGFDFTGTDGQALFNYTLNSGDDRVCKLMPQPLVMVRDVTLTNGETKTLNGQLSRTFARIRLSITNSDTIYQIGIAGLEFKDSYASQKAYLFNDVNAEDATNLHHNFDLFGTSTITTDSSGNQVESITGGTAGALDIASDDAIIKFDTPVNDAQTSMIRMTAGATRHIFDAYILEGKTGLNYAFTFTTYYWTGGSSGTNTTNYHIESWNGNKSTTSGGDHYYGLLDFSVYLRCGSTGQNSRNPSSYLLQAVSNSAVVTDAGDNASYGKTLDPSYVWIVNPITTLNTEHTGVIEGTFQSIGSGLYLQAYNGEENGAISLGYSASTLLFRLNFSGMYENGSIFCKYNGYYYRLTSDTSAHTVKWVNTNTQVGTNDISSVGNISSYEQLTFETVPGDTGTVVPGEQQIATLETTENGTVEKREIARNDFFWGTIPIKVKQTTE